jgi:hypothetical protein
LLEILPKPEIRLPIKLQEKNLKRVETLDIQNNKEVFTEILPIFLIKAPKVIKTLTPLESETLNHKEKIKLLHKILAEKLVTSSLLDKKR